jgi:Zinc dependent phospholipase C
MKSSLFNKFFLLVVIAIFCYPLSSKGYSVLTHEAIIDALWEKTILPLLKQKYPGTTELQLKEAHSYAYGGAIAPDMGYFPLGSHLFTDLVHYVRSGDFVNALLDEAKDINEYAFALGFLSHYMADKYGHFLATNRCVPIVYPKMKKKFGNVVTYDEDNISHKRMEFAFDVLQTAKGNYASMAYHDFIGFNVSRSVLERAFRKIYGLDINDVFVNLSLSIKAFRWSVMSLFPLFTKTAWVIKKDEILKLQPTATSRNFTYKMGRANYYTEHGKKHRMPGTFANLLSWIIRISPKVGPLKAFIKSFDTVLVNFTSSMKILDSGNINFPNIDFDTGYDTSPGEYNLADINYNNLLLKLNKKKFDLLNAELKHNIITFYSDPGATIATENGRAEWKKITRALERLKVVDVSAPGK